MFIVQCLLSTRSRSFEEVTVTRLSVKFAAAAGMGLHVNMTA